MSLPEIVSREEWTHARVALLAQEKALTTTRDALAAVRRRLPMVAVTDDYRSAAAWEARGMPAPAGELHGTSVFLRNDDCVFHTSSAYGRGTEQVGGTHYYLDMTALGRQEDWEEPKGRADSLRPRADQPGAGGHTDRP